MTYYMRRNETKIKEEINGGSAVKIPRPTFHFYSCANFLCLDFSETLNRLFF